MTDIIEIISDAFMDRARRTAEAHCLDLEECPFLTWGPVDKDLEFLKPRRAWTEKDMTAYCGKIDDYCERNKDCERLKD